MRADDRNRIERQRTGRLRRIALDDASQALSRALAAEAAAAADELLARMQAGNRATVATDFATGGPRFTDWLNTRLLPAGTGLPGAGATVTFGAVGGDANTVRIVITWSPPRESQRDTAGAVTAITATRQHVTVSALYD